MVRSRVEVVRLALASKQWPPGLCARWVRTLYDVPASGDVDGDGDADAVDSWRLAKHRHPLGGPGIPSSTGEQPPAGVPVYWAGGSAGHGHIAITLDNHGTIRSTDWPKAGTVGTTTIAKLTAAWGLPYLGWSADIHGHLIPTGEPPRRPAEVRDAIRDARAIRDAPTTGKRRRRIAQTVIDQWKRVRKQ